MDEQLKQRIEPMFVGGISCAVAPFVVAMFFFPVFSDASLVYDNFFLVLAINLVLGAIIGCFIEYLFIKKNWFDGNKLRKLNSTIILVTLPAGFIIEFLIVIGPSYF